MTDHRTAALAALHKIPGVEPPYDLTLGSEATAHALLAATEELAGLRQEQRIANLLTILRDRHIDWPVDQRADKIIDAYLNELTTNENGDTNQ